MVDFLHKKEKSLKVSLPKAKTVHGIEIKKVPIGVYLNAMSELEELPGQIINTLFPGKTITDILAEFTTITDDKIIAVALRLLGVVPEQIIKALALILGVDKDEIINRLTPKELCDVIQEYWKMNDMTDFFGVVSGLIKSKLKLPTLNAGSKSGSPSPKQ